MPSLGQTTTLAPEPASAAAARRIVEQQLTAAGARDELTDAAVLLVSEVVTNALLHAGTDIELRCDATAAGAHIEVVDHSPVRPSLRQHGEEATTGRGMFLLEAIATRSGVELYERGKAIWFVVGDYDDAAEQHTIHDVAEVGHEACFTATFVDVHVEMVRSTLAYGEAVLRELALLEAGNEESSGWQAPQFSLAPLLDALEAAARQGESRTNLIVQFPLDAADRCLERLALVDEGDQLAREGRLLTAAAVPEVASCRRWVYRQIHQQAAGEAPEPWTPPADLPPVVDAVHLSSDDLENLDAADPVIVADDGNRILFINSHAADLLGCDPDDLVGGRLTSVIPPELRLGHLAGFARYQATGETSLLGSVVEVPVLRADGSTELVTLQLEARSTIAGDRVFHARLRRLNR